MPKNFTIYWYQEGPEFTKAFLYNLRDNAVQGGGKIAKGAITTGAVGFVAAECEVFGRTVKTAAFKGNRLCKWKGYELPCKTLASAPAGRVPASQLRDSNYAVAAITSDEVKAQADSLKVPAVKTPEGVWVTNVELGRFGRQGVGRCATLV